MRRCERSRGVRNTGPAFAGRICRSGRRHDGCAEGVSPLRPPSGAEGGGSRRTAHGRPLTSCSAPLTRQFGRADRPRSAAHQGERRPSRRSRSALAPISRAHDRPPTAACCRWPRVRPAGAFAGAMASTILWCVVDKPKGQGYTVSVARKHRAWIEAYSSKGVLAPSRKGRGLK